MRPEIAFEAAIVAGSTPGSQKIMNQIMMTDPAHVYLLLTSRQTLIPIANASQDSAAAVIMHQKLTQRQERCRCSNNTAPAKIIGILAHATQPANFEKGNSSESMKKAPTPPTKSPGVAKVHSTSIDVLMLFHPYAWLPLPIATPRSPSPAARSAARAHRRPVSHWPAPVRSWRPASTPPTRRTPERSAAG